MQVLDNMGFLWYKYTVPIHKAIAEMLCPKKIPP
jgi:hypothetical protein